MGPSVENTAKTDYGEVQSRDVYFCTAVCDVSVHPMCNPLCPEDLEQGVHSMELMLRQVLTCQNGVTRWNYNAGANIAKL